MNTSSAKMTIGRLAKAAGVNVETIRYYQRRKLIPEPEKPYGGCRRYGKADLDRLTFIKSSQSLGFSLSEVAELLELEDGTRCEEASALAEHKLMGVREKIATLQRIEQALANMVESCHSRQGNIDCPLIEALHAGRVTP